MKRLARKAKRFLSSEDGPTAVEYAVMLALIIVVCVGTITKLGITVDTKFGELTANLQAAVQ